VSEDATVGAALLDALAQAGVDVVFGLPGVHNLPMWSAHRDGHPRIVGVRHEQAAAYAADGYARATGRLGVAITTTGPGAANALAAFGEAATCGSPILVIASDVSQALRQAGPGQSGRPRGILHEMNDQAAMFSSFADHGVVATTARSAEAAVEAVYEALAAAATTPTAPRYLGIPSDLLSAACVPQASRTSMESPPSPDPADVASLTELLTSAPRIVLWAGGGVVQCGAEGERALSDLAERLGAPAVTTYAGRGLLADSAHVVTAPVHEPEVAELIANADALVIIGSDADGMNTRNWRMPMPQRIAAISLGASLSRTFDFDVLIAADLVATIDAVLVALDAKSAPAREPWADQSISHRVRQRLRENEATANAMALVDAVSSWPDDGVIVCDMAVSGYWVGGYAPQPRPRRLQYPVGWGTLGYALPAAIGPAAAGLPTLAVCGDGGPMFALGELATIAQEQLPVTLLIVDDGGYGMLRYDQQVFGHPERGVDLLTPDWSALGAAFGIEVHQVGHPTEIGGLLHDSAPGPRMIVLHDRFLPPRTTSPRWFEDVE
jgi:thiamine pyrophosphate-dependent acetolactate synthase large subunit-like protein